MPMVLLNEESRTGGVPSPDGEARRSGVCGLASLAGASRGAFGVPGAVFPGLPQTGGSRVNPFFPEPWGERVAAPVGYDEEEDEDYYDFSDDEEEDEDYDEDYDPFEEEKEEEAEEDDDL